MENQHQTHMAHQQVTTKTMIAAAVAGITIGGPLLALTGFSFLATMTLFIITSPLLMIFSPLLIGAGFVIGAALVGFSAAAMLAIAGLAALGWVFRSVKGDRVKGLDVGSVTDRMVESGETVKDAGKDWASHLKQPVQNSPAANKA